MIARWGVSAACAFVFLSIGAVASAADAPIEGGAGTIGEEGRAVDAVPIHGFTYSAAGAKASSYGISSTGAGTLGAGTKPGWGGAIRAWGSPVDRLTIIGEADRQVTGDFSPSVGAIVRLFGSSGGPFTLGLLGKWKAEGFAADRKEIESEAEAGILLSIHRARTHVDLNALTGYGLADDREADAEARLRVGFDVGDYVRIGFDSQLRKRLLGDRRLPGGRSWDFVAGPQVLGSWKNFFASVMVGPSTIGWDGRGVGWLAMASIGGTSL